MVDNQRGAKCGEADKAERQKIALGVAHFTLPSLCYNRLSHFVLNKTYKRNKLYTCVGRFELSWSYPWSFHSNVLSTDLRLAIPLSHAVNVLGPNAGPGVLPQIAQDESNRYVY